MNNLTLGRLTAIGIACLYIGAVSADTNITTAEKLESQFNAQLDNNIVELQLLGAHNAWNVGSSLFENQSMELDELLESGIRSIDLDIYIVDDEVTLCHDSCGSFYDVNQMPLSEALETVLEYIESNQDAVIFIDIEDHVDEQETVHAAFNDVLGDWIYAPSATSLSGQYDELAALTLREMVDSDKRIHLRSASTTYDNSLIWRGENFAQHADSGWNSVVVADMDTSACTVSGNEIDPNLIYAISDSKIIFSSTGSITEDNIPDIMACGIDIIDADRWDDDMFTSAIWSWASDQPDNWSNSSGVTENCAVQRVSDSSWNDVICTWQYYVACQSTSDPLEWQLTGSKYAFDNALDACTSEYGTSYEFEVPGTALEAQSLIEVISAAGVNAAYINLTDSEEEGNWVKEVAD